MAIKLSMQWPITELPLSRHGLQSSYDVALRYGIAMHDGL